HFDAGSFQLADLLQQRGRRDNDAVAEVHAHGGPQNAGENQTQNGLLAADDERVAGVMAALKADDALRVLGQPVDDLALAFIAPLRADNDDVLAHGVRDDFPALVMANDWSRGKLSTTPTPPAGADRA